MILFKFLSIYFNFDEFILILLYNGKAATGEGMQCQPT